ncbi:MAG: hypothetical protein Q4D95_04180 [Peptoniphilus sp.]|nr:hypothetical protein [Peptoniphilus sp.]
MKKLFRNTLILILMIFMSGCSLLDTESLKIETPSLVKTPMDGKWTVSKIIFQNDEENFFAYKDYIGNDVFITSKGIIAGEIYLKNPTFKAKRIDSEEYLENKFNIDNKKLNISAKYLTILNVYNQGTLTYEMIKVDDENAFIHKDGVFYKINKISGEITEKEFEQVLNRIGKSS